MAFWDISTSFLEDVISMNYMVDIIHKAGETKGFWAPSVLVIKIDIPKGHLAVYVGASQKKRYVIIPIGYIISEPPFVSRFVVSSRARIRV
nr:auxin-induced protein 15A-like [Ipomoea batatas]